MARPQEFNTAEALDRAMRVFWTKGYEATSLVDLLDATELSKSSLYAAFGDKRELFLAAYDKYRDARTHEMNAILNAGPARRAIERFFRKIIADASSAVPSNGCMSTNQAVELAPHDATIRHRVETDFQVIENALTQTIERGQKEGSITRKRKARDLARLLVVAFPGLQVMVRAGAPRARMQTALNLIFTMMHE
jgi:TetR/AcrR family transcriptional repressor of nem operon